MSRSDTIAFLNAVTEVLRISDRKHVAWDAAKAGLAAAREGLESPTEFGWLIENGKKQGEGLAYRYMDNDAGGIPGWTEDSNKALRFARRADAEQYAYHDEDAWRIVERGWRRP